MLVCVCVWEVLRRGGSRAKEDLVRIHVFIVGEKSMRRGLEKAVRAVLHRNAAGQEIVDPGKIWGKGFSLATPFSWEATAASGHSMAGHSIFLLFTLPWERAGAGISVQALRAPRSRGRKGTPASAFSSVSHCPLLGDYGDVNSLLSPSGLFMLLGSLPLTPKTLHVLPSLRATRLKQVELPTLFIS